MNEKMTGGMEGERESSKEGKQPGSQQHDLWQLFSIATGCVWIKFVNHRCGLANSTIDSNIHNGIIIWAAVYFAMREAV